MVELRLNGFNVGVDVGVVEFEIVEHQGARPVVHKFRPLVEERRVVLVCLDDKKPPATEPRADREIGRHATDQEPRRESRIFENPRQHAAGRGLAMRAGNS